MTQSEAIQLCSLGVFSLSLSLSIWTYFQNTRSSRIMQTARLHESWWTPDMMDTRNKVFAICKDHAQDGLIARALVDYYQTPLTLETPAGYGPFAKLMGFFCNLEACMSAGILDDKLVCRLFAESHYKDYQPLIAAIRHAIQEARNDKPIPLWLQQTLDLERRFTRHGAVFPSK